MSKIKFIFFMLIILAAPGLFAQHKPILTVMDFKTNSVAKAEMQAVISQLSDALFKSGKYRIIDSSQRDMLLGELEFSLSDCSDKSCQLQAGKLLSAEFIVTGEMERAGGRLSFSCKLLKTESGALVASDASLYPDLNALLDDLDKVAMRISGLEARINPKRALGIGASIVSYAVFSGGMICLAASLGFWSSSQSHYQDYLDLRSNGADKYTEVYEKYLKGLRNSKITLISGSIASGAGLVSGVLFTVMARRAKQKPAEESALRPLIGPGYAGIQLKF